MINSNYGRLRFSLRTLFIVVTVVSVLSSWVHYELNWLRARRDFIAKHQSRAEKLIPPKDSMLWLALRNRYRLHNSTESPAWPKFALWLFREPEVSLVDLYFAAGDTETVEAELEEAYRLFPEVLGGKVEHSFGVAGRVGKTEVPPPPPAGWF